MMDSALLDKLAWSFIVGALSVSTLTITADRLGSKLAGALGGFPSTVAASLLFLALAKTPSHAAEAASIVPISMGFYGVLLVIYAALLPRGLFAALSLSCLAWALLTFFALSAAPIGIDLSIAGWIVLLVACYQLAERHLSIPSSAGRKVPLRISQLAARMLCGGGVVALSVFLGAQAGPAFGGIAAAFPAVTMATLIVTYQSGGSSLSRAVAKSIMLSGMVNVGVYTTAVYFLYPLLGAVWGTIGGFLIVCCSGLATYLFMARKVV